MERLVIATHNPKKAGEMLMILHARFPTLELRTLADYPGAREPDETGADYAENAAIKANSGAEFTGEWALADDAGLEIDALDGAPGLYSKRFGGEALPFPEKMALILEALKDVPADKRTARFRCCIALAGPAGATPPETGRSVEDARIYEATCEGRIAERPRGGGGFGYDPVFLPDASPGRTMADLTPEEKHEISHRGKVLRLFADSIRPCISS